MITDCKFINPEQTPVGTTLKLIHSCYSTYAQTHPDLVNSWIPRWTDFDSIVYADTNISKSFCFFTMYNNQIVGFCSWDPREKPKAIIGDNCILPEYQGLKLGKAQMLHTLDVLKNHGFTYAIVHTGRDSFFSGARFMYESCGFEMLNEICEDVIEYKVRL